MKFNSKGASFNDRKLAGEVREMGLKHLKRVLAPNFKDKEFQKAVILKISSSLLPRLNEITGQDGNPLIISFDKTFSGTPSEATGSSA